MDRKGKFQIIISSALMLIFASGLYGQSISADKTGYSKDAFSLSLETDLPLLAAGGALFVTEMFIQPSEGAQQSIEELFFLDRSFITSYNADMDTACEILFASSLLLPAAALIEADFEAGLEVGLMFLETLLLTSATKDILKDLIPRYRPYTYVSSPVDDDYINSFPSGHTSAVFAAGGFASYVFSEMYPDSEWRIPVIIGAYSIAAATGVLRVASGNHFVTDVIAGAIIGTVYGIGVPMLHQSDLTGNSGIAVEAGYGEEMSVTVSFRL